MQTSKTLRFKRSKETKNMVKFDEVPPPGEPPYMNNLYLAKWWCKGAEEVKVTVDLQTLPSAVGKAPQ